MSTSYNYSFLSGSGINSYQRTFMKEISKAMSGIESNVYFGFARNSIPWGKQALISIAPTAEISTLVNNTNSVDKPFTDLNSGNNLPKTTREVKIFESSSTSGLTQNSTQIFADKKLYISYINNDWCYIENIDPLWRDYMTDGLYYYITDMNNLNPIVINKKQIIDIPFTKIQCNLRVPGTNTLISTVNLMLYINMFGEKIISGLLQVDYDNALDAGYFDNENPPFELIDFNNVLLANIYIDTVITPTFPSYDTSSSLAKFIVFKENKNGAISLYKLIFGNEIDSFGIWHESLPFTSDSNVDDGNPPALQISYTKTPMFDTSLFDVLGITKIKNDNNLTEMKFMKEIRSSAELATLIGKPNITIISMSLSASDNHVGIITTNTVAGQNIIYLDNQHTFQVGDTLTLVGNSGSIIFTITEVVNDFGEASIVLGAPLNADLEAVYVTGTKLISTTIVPISTIRVATTTDYKTAIRYGMFNILVEKNINGTVATSDIYRQIFICLNPKDSNDAYCTSDTYVHSQLFNTNKYEYNLGQILYIANKTPVLRGYLASEQFKIILV